MVGYKAQGRYRASHSFSRGAQVRRTCSSWGAVTSLSFRPVVPPSATPRLRCAPASSSWLRVALVFTGWEVSSREPSRCRRFQEELWRAVGSSAPEQKQKQKQQRLQRYEAALALRAFVSATTSTARHPAAARRPQGPCRPLTGLTSTASAASTRRCSVVRHSRNKLGLCCCDLELLRGRRCEAHPRGQLQCPNGGSNFCSSYVVLEPDAAQCKSEGGLLTPVAVTFGPSSA